MLDARRLATLLRRFGACDEARAWAEGKDAESAYAACERGDWLLWIAARLGVDRKLIVTAACDCAEPALVYVPAGEDLPRKAIETARAWVRGEATTDEVRRAAAAAYADASAAADAYASADAYADAYAYAYAYASAAAADYAADYAAAHAAAASASAAASAADYAADYAAAHAAAASASAADYAAAHADSLSESAERVRRVIPFAAVAAAAEEVRA